VSGSPRSSLLPASAHLSATAAYPCATHPTALSHWPHSRRKCGEFDGTRYLLERSITADYALVHAKYGDTVGNLVFDKTAMNFNPLAAMAGRITIAQVEELLEPGHIDPAAVHVPGVFVQRIVHTGPQDTRIEKRTTQPTGARR